MRCDLAFWSSASKTPDGYFASAQVAEVMDAPSYIALAFDYAYSVHERERLLVNLFNSWRRLFDDMVVKRCRCHAP